MSTAPLPSPFIRYEKIVASLRDVEALLNAVLETGGFDQLPADPSMHVAFNRSMCLLLLAEERARECLKADAGLEREAA
jgi:hypothetical protein